MTPIENYDVDDDLFDDYCTVCHHEFESGPTPHVCLCPDCGKPRDGRSHIGCPS